MGKPLGPDGLPQRSPHGTQGVPSAAQKGPSERPRGGQWANKPPGASARQPGCFRERNLKQKDAVTVGFQDNSTLYIFYRLLFHIK